MVYVAGLRALIPTLGFIYAGQAAFAAIAVPLKTEKYYDLCGSIGFISAGAFSLYYPYYRAGVLKTGSALSALKSLPAPTLANFHSRQLLMTTMTLVWAARLGSFLYQRIQKSGKDSRFDEIKQSPPKFFGAWMMQATWIALTALPVYMVNSLPPGAQPALGLLDLLGLAMWVGGWGLEIIADNQKSQWRADKEAGKHKESFNSSGVWAYSRHPNYFGEVSLWAGQFVLATSALTSIVGRNQLGPYAVGAAALSPILEYLLIRYVSGVPMLEKSMRDKLRGDAKYDEYLKSTPCFVPVIGSTK